MEQAMETRPGVPQNRGNGLVFDRPRLKWDPVHREGCGIPQNGRNGLVLECYGRKGGPVHREGCGVPQNGSPRDTIHLHCRPPPASTGYHRPPPASMGSCSSSLHRVLLHRLLFNHPSPRATVHPPLHRLLFIQPSTPQGHVPPPLQGHPSTVYCSSSPPHHGGLFNHPSIVYCSSSPPHHGFLFI